MRFVLVKLPILSNKYAAKSGSTDTDNWMIGYNKDIYMQVIFILLMIAVGIKMYF